MLGQYAFAMSTGGVLSIFVSLGFHTYTIREVSKDPRRTGEFVGQVFLLRLVLAAFCWGLLWLACASIGTQPETQVILLGIAAYHLTNKLSGTFDAGFMAHEEMLYPTVLGMLERFIISIGGGAGNLLFFCARGNPERIPCERGYRSRDLHLSFSSFDTADRFFESIFSL